MRLPPLPSLLLVLASCSHGSDGQAETESLVASSSADGDDSSSGELPDPGAFTPDPSWNRREVRFPKYQVPAERTTYACASTSFVLDELEHVVAFEAVIDNPEVVHHMILGVGPGPIDGVEPCYPSSPGVWMHWGWAPGIQPLLLPEEAGMLIGDAPGGQVHYVLQIHYENSAEAEGIVDETGINVYTTRALRKHQASVFLLGDVAGLAIPAREEAFETIHYCRGETTKAFFPEPVHVYGSWLHAHRIGKALWTEQRRDGVVVGELGRNAPYDFGVQYVEPLDAVVEPGDELVTHCIYDSSDRDVPTVGGDGSDDEMCLNYVFHYPALPLPIHCNE